VRSIDEWCRVIHATAVDKGWWEEGRAPLEIHMLVVSEIAEATEAVRSGQGHVFVDKKTKEIHLSYDPRYPERKPEGELIELADAVIRIMDYCGRKDWNLERAIKIKHEYNKTRPHRHGGKKF
jgi:hypothetical protein